MTVMYFITFYEHKKTHLLKAKHESRPVEYIFYDFNPRSSF